MRKTWSLAEHEPFGSWLRAVMIVSSIIVVWAVTQSSPVVPISSGPIGIDAVPVPLNPQNPSEMAIGDFLYAGGLALTSRQTDQLHGLSDLEVMGPDRLSAVGDFGVLLDVRLVFEGAERLVGLADARLTQLTGEDGKPLLDKTDADAEGLARFPNGDRLVSFERRHRIWLYPADGGPPHGASACGLLSFKRGHGSALNRSPEAGSDAYMVGAEASGGISGLRLSSIPCIKGPSIDKSEEVGLVALKRLPGMRHRLPLRAFDEIRGNRISVQVFHSTSLVARMDMAAPMTVDNFEGVAAVPQADGGIRFYLISDDNGSASQRTLLLAFDWRPR